MPKELKSELQKTVGQARAILEDLHRIGVGYVYSQPKQSRDELFDSIQPLEKLKETLAEIENDLGDCQRCNLALNRTKIVFGSGNENTDIVFVGSEPDVEEDRSGEPSVGESGQLLDRILLAMGLQRSEVYILNIVKCRTTESREPSAEELNACEAFLARQIESIRPKVVISLGHRATQALLKSNLPISELRGQWQLYRDFPLMPTYHPGFLLKTPHYKREVWTDMKGVLKKLRELQGDVC